MVKSEQSAQVVRLRVDVRYDGTEFSGWAEQPGRRTVQGTLEAALATVLRIRSAGLTVAGRTDAGVHARGQVCHLDVDRSALPADGGDLDRLARRLNGLLAPDVRVRAVAFAPDGFDARFSAIWRRYAYGLCDEPGDADPLHRLHVLTWPRHLDEKAMNDASVALLGEHDFAAFCKRREGATTVRALRELCWSREGGLLTARVVADAFCHHMVRSLVGALMAVGEGRQPVEWPAQVLAAGVRDPRVTVIPASGLVLEEVGYPADEELGWRAGQARRLRSPAAEDLSGSRGKNSATVAGTAGLHA